MHHLMDVNVLIAWGWADHVDHLRTARWIAGQKKSRASRLYTSAIPEMGFVRVSVQRAAGRVSVQEAADVLRGMLGSLGKVHHFLPDDLAGHEWPEWCPSATRTTDAHLLTLAQRHGLRLATLDTEIPGALILPAPETTPSSSDR